MKKYLIRCNNFHNDHWVMGTALEGEVTSDKSKATIFTGDDLEYWTDRPDFEPVELPEDEYLRRLGENIAPRLPGF